MFLNACAVGWRGSSSSLESSKGLSLCAGNNCLAIGGWGDVRGGLVAFRFSGGLVGEEGVELLIKLVSVPSGCLFEVAEVIDSLILLLLERLWMSCSIVGLKSWSMSTVVVMVACLDSLEAPFRPHIHRILLGMVVAMEQGLSSRWVDFSSLLRISSAAGVMKEGLSGSSRRCCMRTSVEQWVMNHISCSQVSRSSSLSLSLPHILVALLHVKAGKGLAKILPLKRIPRVDANRLRAFLVQSRYVPSDGVQDVYSSISLTMGIVRASAK